ncbi:hypothetical protein N9B09_01815 [bacterium]|nr:hypothetical protein [bacterium]
MRTNPTGLRLQSRPVLAMPWLMIVTVVSISSLSELSNSSTRLLEQDQKNGISWLSNEALSDHNSLPISVMWRDAELKDRLMRFSKNQRVAIFLDRRIDPSTIINLTSNNVTTEQFLLGIAKQAELGICQIEDVYYLGPKKTANSLAANSESILKAANKFGKRTQLRWNMNGAVLTEPIVEPKQLLIELAKANDIKIEGLAGLPHDLWSGLDLPASSLACRLSLLLAGFDKSFQFKGTGKTIEIVNFKPATQVTQTFGDINDPSSVSKLLRKEFKSLKFSTRRNQISITGEPDSVGLAGMRAIESQKPEMVTGSTTTFSLTTRAARGAIFATAAQRVQLKFSYDKTNPAVSKALKEPVAIQAVNEPLHRLLEMTIQDSPLTFKVTDTEIIVSAK